jgi:hypothetical protein
MPRPHWRKMTWVLIIFTVIMFAWVIGGATSAQDDDCDAEPTAELRQLCEDATDVGTGIGVGLIFFLWFLGFVVLGLIWFMTRPKGRDCPACGETVKKGRTTCPKCGFDLAAAARGDVQPPASPAG